MTGVRMPALPAERPVPDERMRAAVAGAPCLVVLDDDPTGTQTVRGLPVLTGWDVEDIRWALRQGTDGIFILTNSRSLSAPAADAVNREAAAACLRAAAAEGRAITFASRSDSTLRGHFPLEVTALSAAVAPDAVIIAPAYVDAGRITIDSVHWVRSGDELVAVGETEFARDATFGYTRSSLPEWVAEKSGGAVPAADVARITLTDLREGGPDAVAARLAGLRGGRMVALDAVTDDDLRVFCLAAIEAERAGRRLLYRVGPSFVRARTGQPRHPPLSDAELAGLVARPPGTGGLIVVGSHVSLTTRQLERLRRRVPVRDVEVAVGAPSLTAAVRAVADGLAAGHVVVHTPRELVRGATPEDSLAIARQVSADLSDVVRRGIERVRPAFVVAKGGITSADIATRSLGIRRAWIRGTLLPGVVSLWQPAPGGGPAVPYVVFAGNVGDEHSLADVVERLGA
ncbi:four-carbon acid sugar kinase family protein [Dactylosporangium sp. CA-092794]|uniref:four-carbon acid sugar kinase family protein n=1 Tax=Dactylosporangium sp. CA-092794 TaxID=3239929 RepID=UPI003D8DADB5